MNLGALVKIVRGGMGGFDLDQAVALAKGMGWDLRMQELTEGQRPTAFQKAAVAAVQPGSKAMAVSGFGKEGERIEALLIFVPAEQPEKKA